MLFKLYVSFIATRCSLDEIHMMFFEGKYKSENENSVSTLHENRKEKNRNREKQKIFGKHSGQRTHATKRKEMPENLPTRGSRLSRRPCVSLFITYLALVFLHFHWDKIKIQNRIDAAVVSRNVYGRYQRFNLRFKTKCCVCVWAHRDRKYYDSNSEIRIKNWQKFNKTSDACGYLNFACLLAYLVRHNFWITIVDQDFAND